MTGEKEALYDRIGDDYDTTRHADSYIVSRLIDLLSVEKGGSVLDIACGTGNYTTALERNGYKMTGVDCSSEMLGNAKEKSETVNWMKGFVESLPIADGLFDGCICTLAIHHFNDLKKVFSEVYRVISKGRFVLMTCSHKQVRNYWLYRYFPEALETLTEYMPDFDVVIDSLSDAGFYIKSVEPYYVTDELTDNFLGCQKNHPELYLDEDFRNGMSIFSAKASAEAVASGCAHLAEDIENGSFAEFIKNHRNPIGEYMFITAEKR